MTATSAPVVTVRIPAQIRRLYGALTQESVQAADLRTLVRELDRRYPGMGERLTEPDGELRRWVNIFVDGDDVRSLAGIDTVLTDGAEVQIVPSVAGGMAPVIQLPPLHRVTSYRLQPLHSPDSYPAIR